jgi:hypothetical protein
VAYYTPHPDGGYTSVYFRRGSSFEEVQLPTIPNLKFPRQGSVDEQAITKISEPKRWLESGALVLHQEQERLVAGSAAQKVTIGFDKHGHGSVLKVEAKATEDALEKDPQLLVLPEETAYFQAIASDSINDLTMRVSNRDGHLRQGDNETSIQFRDAKARLVDVGKVNLQIDNNMPGAQIHRDVVVERTATRGLYHAKIQVDISGDWNMKISYDGPYGKGETTFPVPAE